MPPIPSHNIFLQRAAELRDASTSAEKRLWTRLRSHRLEGVHFRRQYVIGPYITDFCAPRLKLIIELDGSQHLDQENYDTQQGVLSAIYQALEKLQ